MRAIRVYAVAVLAVAVVAAGCGGGDGTPAAACEPLGGGGTGVRRSVHAAPETTFLTAVEIDASRCVDRLGFDFRDGSDGAPGFRVEYLPASRALVEDGSGEPIDVKGSAFLVVRLEPAATAEIEGEQVVPTYDGPNRLAASGTRFVREVVKSGDFEAVVTWVVGLTEERPFRVSTPGGAARVLVEIG
jgi:hypothetical protein